MLLNLENAECVTLKNDDLATINGGITPIVIGGVTIGWKLIGGIAGVMATSGVAGAAAGYYGNRP